MEILGKKSNRMSRANAGVSKRSEFPDLQRILDFLSLRNLLSNELFFTFFDFYLKNTDKMYIIIVVSIVITIRSGITNFNHLL